MDKLNLVELTKSELTSISGGSRLRILKELVEVVWIAIGIHDAIESFKDGWNDCAPEAT